ncbi:MAG: ATP-dependent Clp protease ATP-binding subunit [Patescibacteria group bacterium]|jgi:ATP-dependent Clp protease ATP-binding subunit ClpC
MTEAPNQLQFKQTAAEFVSGWNSSRALAGIGQVIGFGSLLVSMLALALQTYRGWLDGEMPIVSLFGGSALARMMWVLILLDIVAVYLLDEIRRRKTYTSRDDVYNFLDQNSRSFLAQALSVADKNKQKLTVNMALHLMLQSGSMRYYLAKLEIVSDSVYEAVKQQIPLDSVPQSKNAMEMDNTFQQYLLDSANRAAARGDSSFGLPDIFLTILEKDANIAQFFSKIDITPKRFAVVINDSSTRDHLLSTFDQLKQQRMHTGPVNRAWTSTPTPMLNQFGQDLTVTASAGAIPLVTVRQKEVDEAIRVLARATKNSLLLVGEPGAGKATVVDRIAFQMLSGSVPKELQDKRLVQLDAAALHGSPEGFSVAFEQLLAETERSGNVILFIPSLQDLASEQTSGVAVAELLLPLLDRARMQVIGATTIKQYREEIEPNVSFAKAFGVVQINEMSPDQAMTVLEETALELEGQHHVKISLKAIEAAVTLSAKFIHDRVLPEKAIDILDEASAMASAAKKAEVTEADVQTVISQKTNVPTEAIGQNEQSTLLDLEKIIGSRVVGQVEAVQAVSKALRRARAGLSDSNRPIGTFLFVGPTGVGKTELAKALASSYFKGEDTMVRLDMSEFQSAASLVDLIGQNNKEGVLTGPVRNRPFCLLLLDEFEKACDEVRNLFLSIFDDGRITDGNGHLIDFKNCIIIATSNAGSLEIQQAIQSNVPYTDIQKKLGSTLLPQIFRPELLNRFDGIIVFKPLTADEILKIAKLQVEAVIKQTEATSGVKLAVTDAVIQKLATDGFDPTMGGRPLRRVVQDELESPLANKIIAGNAKRGDQITIDVGDLG